MSERRNPRYVPGGSSDDFDAFRYRGTGVSDAQRQGRRYKYSRGRTRIFTSSCTSFFMMYVQSFTPRSNTDWLPRGIPASARRAQACFDSGVTSFG